MSLDSSQPSQTIKRLFLARRISLTTTEERLIFSEREFKTWKLFAKSLNLTLNQNQKRRKRKRILKWKTATLRSLRIPLSLPSTLLTASSQRTK